MKITKLISILLAVLMLLSSLAIVTSAAESDGESGPQYSTNTGNGNSLMMKDPNKEGQYLYKDGKYKDKDGNTKVVSTPEEKLALMDFRYGTDKYELYVDAYSGEVAVRSKETGETLFTNPYNIGHSNATSGNNNVKDELLSQLIVYYSKVTESNSDGSLKSYTMSAVRNQIVVKNIKGGIRVEYTIGTEETRSLLPRMVEASVMEEIFATIEANMEAAIADGQVKDPDEERQRLVTFKAYYNRYSLDDAYDPKTGLNQEIYNSLVKDYEILAEFEELAKTDPTYEHFAIYVVDEKNMGENVIKKQESLIKEYCKEYTYEMLEEDHAFVKYVPETESYPLFKVALEYYIEDTGLVVSLPANGIRYDQSLYYLEKIDVLPYMGSATNPNGGYTFFPDGSGTLFDFEEIAVKNKIVSVAGTIYGNDFAYHNITGGYEQIIRYPVFGLYEKDGDHERGFVAIIEEGDALMDLTTYHGGNSSEYNTVKMTVRPSPKDEFLLKDSISVSTSNDKQVVRLDRFYSGSFTVRYVMLTSEEVAKENKLDKYYDTSYVGMANAYRDYLIKNGILTKLTEEDVEDDIPLYIEVFGAMETTERFLTIPINVMTPLTSFEDVKTMYTNLSDNNITNVNFILTGFTDGGMGGEKAPYNLKWESAVKKEMDFDELNEYAKNEGFGIFPNFDFVYASNDTLFDGLYKDTHAAKTIDDRYVNRREYSATKHTYVSYYEIALSPAYFSHFYEKFIPKYAKLNPVGISIGTLGSELNSDFDEDEPYNRADSKNFTIKAFEYISSELKDTEILTSGGNAYTWKYVDHITDIALDSSRFNSSAASVPFLGIVLHGYVEVAGTAVNMEGNLDYAFLKALESGAALKFILSYRNTEELKESETLSNYYAISYKNWYLDGTGDLVTMYQELNELLKDVQTSQIVGHTYLDGTRVPDDDELKLDAEQAIKDAIAYEEALANATSDTERLAIFNARQLIIKGYELLKNATNTTDTESLISQIEALRSIFDPTTATGEYADILAEAEKALEAAKAYQQLHAITADAITLNVGVLDFPTKLKPIVEAYKVLVEAKKALDEADKDTDLDKYNAADAAYKAAEAAFAAKADEIEELGEYYIVAVAENKLSKYSGLNVEVINPAVDAYNAVVEAKKALDEAEKTKDTDPDKYNAADDAYKKAEAAYAKVNKQSVGEELAKWALGGKVFKVSNVTVELAIEAYQNLAEAEQTKDTDPDKYNAALATYESYKAIIGEDYILAAIAYLNASEDEKEAKKVILAGMVAGTDVSADTAIQLMNALEPYKTAWVEANASGDKDATAAAKAVFDAKLKEIYGPLVATLTEEIKFENTSVGGTRYHRDGSKTAYANATAALTEKLNELYSTASAAMDIAEQIREIYNLEAIKAAYQLLVDKGAYSDSERARLEGFVNELEDLLTNDAKAKAEYETIIGYDINASATEAYKLYEALVAATNAAGVETKLGDLVDYELSGFKASDYLKGSAYSWTTKIVEEKKTEVAKPVPNTQKYESDSYTIVHEVFEDGTEFLLNFNNYRIIVEVNGKYYDIDKYGYVVLNRGTNA